MDDHLDLESSIRKRGLDIFVATRDEVPSFFNKKNWSGKLMAWAMKDERFKIQLFHFIDVLPSLNSDDEVVKLLKEYFMDEEDLLPKALKRWIPKRGFMAKVAGNTIRRNVEILAKQFIAAEDRFHVSKPINFLRDDGRAFTIDLLGEAVLSNEEATLYRDRYLELLEELHNVTKDWSEISILDNNHVGTLPKISISLKISSFYSRLDPIDFEGSIDGVKKELRPIFQKATDINASITLDMEHYDLKNITLAIFKSVLDDFPLFIFAGIAIQSYLKDSEKDLTDLICWARENKRVITVRLVKGAYWDFEKIVNKQRSWPIPVFESKGETDYNFEKLTRLIIDNRDVIRPAIASHNIRSIANAMAYSDSLSLPKNTVEFQSIFGMAEPVKRAVSAMGYRVREYLPVGEFLPGMAYLVRRLLENTSNESFLRQSFAEKVNVEALLAKPVIGQVKSSSGLGSIDIFSNMPLTDFSIKSHRVNFKKALLSVKEHCKFSEIIPCIIGKNKVFTKRNITSINPAFPKEVVGTVSLASQSEAEKAVNIASSNLEMWRKTDVKERANYLFQAAIWIEERRFEIAALELLEVGKGWREADADVAEAIDFLNYYGREMINLSVPLKLGKLPGELNEQHYLPRGVCAVISPWNFPLAISCGMASAALVAGNCVILKPSSLSPVTAYKLFEAFQAVGLPDGILQFLPGPGREVGDYLVEHPHVDVIAFTGSKEVGLGIVERAGKTSTNQRSVKKVIAEMGGKNAIIVDGSADIDEAVMGVLNSSFSYQGQKCSACSRVIVMESIYNKFLTRLIEAARSLSIGSPDNPANILGPLIDSQSLKKTNKYNEIGNSEAIGNNLRWDLPIDGFFASPSIFSDVMPDYRISTEEIFGPVLSVIKVSDIDIAIEIANSTPYALTAGIYSRSPENIRNVTDRLMVGNLYINRNITGAMVGRQPFGGFGMSGLGSKAGGEDYLLNFLNPKCVTVNTLRRGFAPEI